MLITRLSGDEIRHGRVWNGFDYALQVWVINGVIQGCEHPRWMRPAGIPCCNAHILTGRRIVETEGAQKRENRQPPQNKDDTL